MWEIYVLPMIIFGLVFEINVSLVINECSMCDFNVLQICKSRVYYHI